MHCARFIGKRLAFCILHKFKLNCQRDIAQNASTTLPPNRSVSVSLEGLVYRQPKTQPLCMQPMAHLPSMF